MLRKNQNIQDIVTVANELTCIFCGMNKFEEELDDDPNKTLFPKAVPPFNEK